MKDNKRTYTTTSAQFGDLIEGTSQVYREFEPADATTNAALEFWLTELGIKPDRPKSKEKYIRALSDFCMAHRYSIDGRIFWPSANAELSGNPYTGSIVRPLMKALKGRYMRRVQRSSKRDKLCAVYEANIPDFGHPLKFKLHGIGPVIKVRSPRLKKGGKTTGGQSLSLKKFNTEEIQNLQGEIRIIRACMARHPLTHPNGVQFRTITRIFNNASTNQGGRSYGTYQNYAESERLTMTIDNEAVCEIDIKSCYLSIMAGKRGISLPDDPYSVLPYVMKHELAGSASYKQARSLMKLMVSKLLSSEAEASNFPQGDKIRTEDGGSTTLSVKQKYSLPKKLTAKKLYDEIYEVYPFMRDKNQSVFELMNIESNIMTATLLELALKDIPAYPVHDCLICKASDKDIVLAELRNNLKHYIGCVPAMDITYPDGECKLYKAEYPDHYTPYFKAKDSNPTKEDDNSLIDDYYEVIEPYFDNEGEERKGIEEENSTPEAWEIQPIRPSYTDYTDTLTPSKI